jgi:MFS family permease
MRPVQIIQATSAAIAAIVITFLQPQRDQIGVLVIGTMGLLILAIGFAISHLVTAVLQKKRRAYISNGILLVFFAAFIYICITEFQRMAERVNLNEPLSKGADNTFDLNEFVMLSMSFLVLGGFGLLAIAIAHRQFKNIYRDNLISATIFLVFGLAPLAITGIGQTFNGVIAVGLLNTACIFTAVHLGIVAASPTGEAIKKTKA